MYEHDKIIESARQNMLEYTGNKFSYPVFAGCLESEIFDLSHYDNRFHSWRTCRQCYELNKLQHKINRLSEETNE